MDKGGRVKGQESGVLKIWFLGVVVAVLLVIGGVEVNPGPPTEQGKIDKILAYVRNQEKESKIIKQMVELHKQEMAEMKKSTDALGQKLDRVSEIVGEIMTDYGQTIKEWEGYQQHTEERFRHLYEEKRKNNILIFRLHEGGGENYLGTLELTVKFLRDSMGVEVSKENIDYLTRLGRRRGERPILVRFTAFFKKLEVLRNRKNLAGTKIRVDEDLSIEDRRTRSELIPYLKDAKKRGHKAFLRKHTLMVDGKTYGSSYPKENIQLADVDNPGNKLTTISQQRTGNEANDRRGGETTPAVRPWRGSEGRVESASLHWGDTTARSGTNERLGGESAA
jgi:hypothetical protein